MRCRRRERRSRAGPAADPAAEWAALERALSATAADVREAQSFDRRPRGRRADAAIFDAHLLFLEDEALLGPARDGVFSCREPAARAWADAVTAAAAELGQAGGRVPAGARRRPARRGRPGARPPDRPATRSHPGAPTPAQLPASSSPGTSRRPTSPASIPRPSPASPARSADRRHTR